MKKMTIEDAVSHFKEEHRKARIRQEEMTMFENINVDTQYKNIQYDKDRYPSVGKPLVVAALCPNKGCENVDCRFMSKKHEKESSMQVLDEYAGSGYILKCRVCDTDFSFCGTAGYFGNYELENYVRVPREFLEEQLNVFL